MKPETFRRMVKWLGIVILAHLAAMLIFAIVLAGSAESFAKESPAYAYSIVLTFDIIFYVAFVFLVNRLETSYADFDRNLKNAMKSEDFTVFGYYKSNFLNEQLIKAAVMSGFHIPFAVFYQVLGFSLTATTKFEQFYILDAGFYGVAGSAVLGFLLWTVTVTAIWLVINVGSLLLRYYILKKEIESFK